MAFRLDFSPWCGTAPPTFTEWGRVQSRRRPPRSEEFVALPYTTGRRAASAKNATTPLSLPGVRGEVCRVIAADPRRFAGQQPDPPEQRQRGLAVPLGD